MAERLTMPLWEPLPAAQVAEAFAYDAETGVVRWRTTGKGRHAKKDGVVGFKKGGTQYLMVKFHGKTLPLHRLAWCLHHGAWPEQLIDHINGEPGDNRLENLRMGDKQLNAENQRRARADNSSGVLGVRAHGNKFRAQLRTGGRTVYLGLFATKDEAHHAYVQAKRALHAGCSL